MGEKPLSNAESLRDSEKPREEPTLHPRMRSAEKQNFCKEGGTRGDENTKIPSSIKEHSPPWKCDSLEYMNNEWAKRKKELLEYEGRKIGLRHPPTISRVYSREGILLRKNKPVVLHSL